MWWPGESHGCMLFSCLGNKIICRVIFSTSAPKVVKTTLMLIGTHVSAHSIEARRDSWRGAFHLYSAPSVPEELCWYKFAAWTVTLTNQHDFFQKKPCNNILTFFLLPATHRERSQKSLFRPAGNTQLMNKPSVPTPGWTAVLINRSCSTCWSIPNGTATATNKVNASYCCLIVNV